MSCEQSLDQIVMCFVLLLNTSDNCHQLKWLQIAIYAHGIARRYIIETVTEYCKECSQLQSKKLNKMWHLWLLWCICHRRNIKLIGFYYSKKAFKQNSWMKCELYILQLFC